VKWLVWWLTISALWLAALWRIPTLPGPWGVPDGLLLALLAWAFAWRTSVSWTVPMGTGALMGGLKDLASGGPGGSWLLIFAGTAWVATRSARLIVRDHPLAQVVWITVFAMGTILAHAMLLVLRGERMMAGPLVGYFLIPSALATALTSLLLFPLLRRILPNL